MELAFKNCALLLQKLYRNMTIMFTRCPFPPDSYPWEAGIDNILDNEQLYFILALERANEKKQTFNREQGESYGQISFICNRLSCSLRDNRPHNAAVF